MPDSCGTTKKNMFLGFLPNDTVLDCSIKEHRFWPTPSTFSQSWEKKIEVEEEAVWLVILEKEMTNNSWEPL